MHIRTCHCSRFRAAKLCAWWTIARADVGTLTHCLHALIDRHQWRGLYGFYCTRRRYDQRRCSGADVVGQVHDGHNVVLAEYIIDRFESAPEAPKCRHSLATPSVVLAPNKFSLSRMVGPKTRSSRSRDRFRTLCEQLDAVAIASLHVAAQNLSRGLPRRVGPRSTLSLN